MNKSYNSIEEKRKYLRVDTIFPIEFQLAEKEEKEPLSELHEGFTRNIGTGGMTIFTRSLKSHDKKFFNFIPHKTKLKLVINIPLDREPIESLATVEWVERETGSTVNTYMFGVSYDSINELKYEKALNCVRWLHLKPKLMFLAMLLLAIVFAGSLAFLFGINERMIENEKKLAASLHENKKAERERVEARKEKIRAEAARRYTEKKHTALLIELAKLKEEKNILEKNARLDRSSRKKLQAQLEKLGEEKILLEEELWDTGKEEALITETEEGEETEENGGIEYERRLKAEEGNYNRCTKLILNEKIQSLSAYVSAYKSSIYHAAAIFALAELRYKYRKATLAEVSYNQVVEMYPESTYALYSSHRLEQLRRNYNYGHYTLKYFHDTYNLPKLFDYRRIKPYWK
ncbi:MAG: hypothetical protein U9R52_04495 [Candidatus Omnitrophota bacterium]|nr:hypothetical protein [Candidatus Omnitrophota bacterium]